MHLFHNVRCAVGYRHPKLKPHQRQNLYEAAMHEAAHVLVALLMGERPLYIRVNRGGGGSVLVGTADLRDLLISLAGPAAELVLNPDGSTLHLAAPDDEDARRLLARVTHPERIEDLRSRVVHTLVELLTSRHGAAMLTRIAVWVIERARKDTGELSPKKTAKLCAWVDEYLRSSGLYKRFEGVRSLLMHR